MNVRKIVLLCLGSLVIAVMPGDVGIATTTVGGDALAVAELRRAAERAQTCSASTGPGVGLLGEYYAGEFWQGTAIEARTEGPVDFDTSLDFGKDSVREHARSARWTGWIKAPISGSYRFHADAPHVEVLVAKKLLAGDKAAADAQIEMSAGRYYPVVVTAERFTTAVPRLRLEWTAPHGARFLVPRVLLFPPSATVENPP